MDLRITADQKMCYHNMNDEINTYKFYDEDMFCMLFMVSSVNLSSELK